MLAKAFANPALTKDVLRDVLEYLASCGLSVPRFRTRVYRRLGGSYFLHGVRGPTLNLGCYGLRFWTEWFVMHEVGHVLWDFYDPCRNRMFRRWFGEPTPANYDSLGNLPWRGPVLGKVARPIGEPSHYGAAAGGEERFCELLGYMYAHGGFDRQAPSDLRRIWSVCWIHGLSRMSSSE